MLAAVITLADANAGLDIMSNKDAGTSWLRTLYLRMLNDPRVVALTYSDLQSTDKSELAEMQVRVTGCDGAAFKAVMPFSWIIKDKMDMLIHQAQDMPGTYGIRSVAFTSGKLYAENRIAIIKLL